MKPSEIKQSKRIIKEINNIIIGILKSHNFDDEEDQVKFKKAWDAWSYKEQKRVKEYLSELKVNKPELYHPFWDTLTAI